MKYSTRDLIRTYVIWVNQYLIKLWLKTRIKYENHFFNLHLKDSLQMLRQADPVGARTSSAYVTHTATFWVRNSYWRNQVGHAQNI